jgi:hypothetical protein
MLQRAHQALVNSLSPLILKNSSSSKELDELFPPPSALIVGVWRRPTKEHPYGQGYTAPTKVYYSPDQSGTPDIACQVSGLTEVKYRDTVLQPWRAFPDDSSSNIRGGIRDRIFLANNDYSCLNVRYFWGDWAEETLLQAERAMLLLGTPPPSWTQNHDYYTAEVVEKVYYESSESTSASKRSWKSLVSVTTVTLTIFAFSGLLVLIWKVFKGYKDQRQAQYTPLP